MVDPKDIKKKTEDEEFDIVVEESMQRNKELLKRLAKM